MRKPLLLAAAVAALAGCKSAPPPDQITSDRFLDEQIALSAASISQAQERLHQTSAAPVAPVPPPATPMHQPSHPPLVVSSPGVPPLSAPPQRPAAAVVAQSKPAVTPVIATVTTASAPTQVASATAKAAPSPVTVVPAKVIPVASVPPVVFTKVTTPPKPLPDPWTVSPNDATLRRALNKWAQRAGWQLVWEASVDVPISVNASFTGDFNTAVKGLFQSLSAADVNLSAVLYSGNRVLRVTESGRRAQ